MDKYTEIYGWDYFIPSQSENVTFRVCNDVQEIEPGYEFLKEHIEFKYHIIPLHWVATSEVLIMN